MKKTKADLATKKNEDYLEYIMKMSPEEILPGVIDILEAAKQKGFKLAIGSASKNAVTILKRVDLLKYFDTVVDGNKVSKAKPDPEVFLNAAKELGVKPEECIVFEDAEAGVEAALNGNLHVVGVGDEKTLNKAEMVIPGFKNISLGEILNPGSN
jgi:beta-phosphoglucomutase